MSFIIRRLVFYVVAAWVALTINFFIPRLMPGNLAKMLSTGFPVIRRGMKKMMVRATQAATT